MAGSVCALLFAAQAVAARDDLMVGGPLRVLLGLACLLLWLALIQYLEFEPRYFTLVLTIRSAIPRIGQFLVGACALSSTSVSLAPPFRFSTPISTHTHTTHQKGILPMFLGYVILGTILFGDRTEFFGSVPRTAATLFCVVVRAWTCVYLHLSYHSAAR